MSFVLIIIAQQKLIDHNLRMRGEDEEDQGRCKERSAKTDRITLGFQRWQDVEILIFAVKGEEDTLVTVTLTVFTVVKWSFYRGKCLDTV